MKKEFTHYGQKVLLAGNRSRYEMILEKNNVEYIPLPILSKTYRVVKYNNKYAVILTKETEDDLESVIVTESSAGRSEHRRPDRRRIQPAARRKTCQNADKSHDHPPRCGETFAGKTEPHRNPSDR